MALSFHGANRKEDILLSSTILVQTNISLQQGLTAGKSSRCRSFKSCRCIYLPRGRSLSAHAIESVPIRSHPGFYDKDGTKYRAIHISTVDPPDKNRYITGIFGRCDDRGVWQMGLRWGKKNPGYDLFNSLERHDRDLLTQDKVTLNSQDLEDLLREYNILKSLFVKAQQNLKSAKAEVSLAKSNST
ncbi:hypothetical protein ACLMJK_000076 [Lecanora helva]